ncbi:MAG: hypothetical protein R8K54_04945 [Mariprofundaceae bacterium]
MAIAIIVAVVAREYFTTDSFGIYGHYRANSVPEIASLTPTFQGEKSCNQCHVERHAMWSQGRHQSVSCENCHGAAGNHPLSGKLPIPIDTVKLCAACHEAMPARPAHHPQVVIKEHAADQACIECHNPHSPLHFRWEEMQSLGEQLIATSGMK